MGLVDDEVRMLRQCWRPPGRRPSLFTDRVCWRRSSVISSSGSDAGRCHVERGTGCSELGLIDSLEREDRCGWCAEGPERVARACASIDAVEVDPRLSTGTRQIEAREDLEVRTAIRGRANRSVQLALPRTVPARAGLLRGATAAPQREEPSPLAPGWPRPRPVLRLPEDTLPAVDHGTGRGQRTTRPAIIVALPIATLAERIIAALDAGELDNDLAKLLPLIKRRDFQVRFTRWVIGE
jgi:hypothetical protein